MAAVVPIRALVMRMLRLPPAASAVLMTATSMAAIGAAHSWVANAVTPALRERGVSYIVDGLAADPSTPAAGAHIGTVTWRLAFDQPRPRGLDIRLCSNGRCIPAPAPGGTSRFFAGLPARTEFAFQFRVAGHGMLAQPLWPAPMQLIVNGR